MFFNAGVTTLVLNAALGLPDHHQCGLEVHVVPFTASWDQIDCSGPDFRMAVPTCPTEWVCHWLSCTPEGGSRAFFRDVAALIHCEDEPLFCTSVKLDLSH